MRTEIYIFYLKREAIIDCVFQVIVGFNVKEGHEDLPHLEIPLGGSLLSLEMSILNI